MQFILIAIRHGLNDCYYCINKLFIKLAMLMLYFFLFDRNKAKAFKIKNNTLTFDQIKGYNFYKNNIIFEMFVQYTNSLTKSNSW